MVLKVFCDLYREILVFDFSDLVVTEVVNLVLVKEVMLGAEMGHVCVNRVSSLQFRCGALSVLLDVAEICPFGTMRHGVGVVLTRCTIAGRLHVWISIEVVLCNQFLADALVYSI